MEIIKQCVGIDISKETFTASIAYMKSSRSVYFSEVAGFQNDKSGFNKFLRWTKSHLHKSSSVTYIMEATGTYFEMLAYHLYNLKKEVAVMLPNMVNHFAKSLNVKSKTDNEDARVIARMGVERKLMSWCPPEKHFKELRALSRLYNTLKKDKTMISNRLSALNCGHVPCETSVEIYTKLIVELDEKLTRIEKEMETLLKSDSELSKKVETLLTIPGVGLKTISLIIGETQGFKLFKNQRQLVSYSGLDVVRTQSGTSVNKRGKISKKGNSHIRAALYFPALSAARFNDKMKNIYDRINVDKPNKMIGTVAIQRKMLVLIFSIWKSGTPFDKNYGDDKSDFNAVEDPSSSSTQRVEKVDGAKPPSTQNEHLRIKAAEVLLRQQ